MKKQFRVGVITLLALTLISAGVLTGCGNNETQPPTENPGEDLSGFFQIKGSDSEVNLVTALVEAYAEVNDQAEFSVSGGGSGTGIAALINNQTDIANSSRPMKDQEISDAKAQGVEPVPIVFSMDGVAVIVNANNPVEKLTVAQIGKIFAGEITNWSEVGGADKEITLYGRQSSSGTFIYFRDRVVKTDYSQAMNQMNGNSDIVEGVSADETGIGYCAIGFLKDAKGIRALLVSEDGNDPFITPADLDRVKNGEYVLTRPLFQYFNGTPTGALRDFVEFVLSEAGQSLIEEEGFLPVTAEFKQENAKYLK